MNFKIAFDVNGNDKGVEASIKASLYFVKENPNIEIVLVGDKVQINQFLTENHCQISVIDNPNTVKFDENIRNMLRENTSMKEAINLVKNNQADAVITSGDSGSYLALCTFILGRLEGVSRPAFMPIMPTIKGKKFLLLDVGANLNTKSDFLVEWSVVANEYAKVLLNVENPKVALLNIGTEDYKGLEIVREANQKLIQTRNLNYIGFQEPRDILNYTTDIAVIDGYGGNLVLKSLEGAILSFKDLIKQNIMKKTLRKIGYLFLKGAFKDVSETLDYRNVGAAWVIGLKKLAIKSHGSSDYKSYVGALNQIKLGLNKNLNQKIVSSLNNLSSTE